ncbi:hypothetical protein F4815DRAFT_104957 [Daldinia loculata]|nr:hypothetical protein F4815DRAFT_104957 [Daldinia loculata]
MASAGTRLRRAVVSVPFLFIAALCLRIMDPSTIVAFQQPFADSGVIEWDGGKIPIIDNFHGIHFLDNIFRGGMATFSASTFGYDPMAWWQIFSFLTDLGPVYAIWILESYRVGYAYTPAYFPTVFTVAGQFLGIGPVAPIFYFLSLTFGPTASDLARLPARDRGVWNRGNGLVFLLIFLFHTSEVFAMCLAPELTTRHYWTWAWQMSPLYIGLANVLLSGLTKPLLSKLSFVSPKSLLAVAGIISAGVWGYTLLSSPYSLATIFIPTSEVPSEFIPFVQKIFQADHLSFFTSSFLWLIYSFLDLNSVGIIGTSWLYCIPLLPVSIGLVGPASTFTLFWYIRERALASS